MPDYTPPLNTWEHICLVSPTSGNGKFYVNGVLVGQTSGSVNMGNTISVGTFHQCYTSLSASDCQKYEMTGFWDSLFFKKTALSDENIKDLFDFSSVYPFTA